MGGALGISAPRQALRAKQRDHPRADLPGMELTGHGRVSTVARP
jgi:hypothetical protein